MTSTLMSPEDVASHCALSSSAVYRAIERWELHAAPPLLLLRVRPAVVEAWIEAKPSQPIVSCHVAIAADAASPGAPSA